MSHAFNNERYFFFISAWLFAFLGMTQTTFAKLQTNDDSLCKQPEYIEKILRQHTNTTTVNEDFLACADFPMFLNKL